MTLNALAAINSWQPWAPEQEGWCFIQFLLNEGVICSPDQPFLVRKIQGKMQPVMGDDRNQPIEGMTPIAYCGVFNKPEERE